MGVQELTSQWDNDNPNDSTDQDQTKGLRGHVKKLEEELKSLRQERDAAVTQARQAAISTALTAKGVNPKIAKLIPADVAATPEAIETWLTEYGDVFGAKPPEVESPPVVDAETQAQLAQMQQLTALQQGVVPPQGKYDDIMAQLTDRELTQDKLLALIEQHGGGIGQG